MAVSIISLDCCVVQALSKALLDLRANMVSHAQSEVLVNAEQAAAEVNIQRLVDKRTKELQVYHCCTVIIDFNDIGCSVTSLIVTCIVYELCYH